MSVFLFYYEENETTSLEKDELLIPHDQYIFQQLTMIDEKANEFHGFVIHDGTSSGDFFYNDVEHASVDAFLIFIDERIKKKLHPCFVFKFINDAIIDRYSLGKLDYIVISYVELALNWKKYMILDKMIKVIQ